ncbi:hypothetical protein J6590_042751 [Homalodisca vitripennis]|nr:hypothetical protein J6590_042751 [Homalodisca vitripennis]
MAEVFKQFFSSFAERGGHIPGSHIPVCGGRDPVGSMVLAPCDRTGNDTRHPTTPF